MDESTKPDRQFLDLTFARSEEQRQVMQHLIDLGVCPFCPEHIDSPDVAARPVIKRGAYWHIRQNHWPYDNTRVHLLFIHKTHAEQLADISPDAWEELGELVRWAEQEFQTVGGALCLRFGDTKYTGATVKHLHAHLVVPDVVDRSDPHYKEVVFPLV